MKRNKFIFNISCAQDFEKLRNINKNIDPIIIIRKNIDFAGYKFKPIDAEKFDITIKGNNFTLYNLKIDSNREPNVGIFSKVNSIDVENLNLLDFNIKGGVNTGSLVGRVEKDVEIKNSTFTGTINCEAYGGGIIGSCDDLILEDTKISSKVIGYDIVGGVVGLVDKVRLNNSEIKSTVKSVGKANGTVAGYNTEKEAERVARMTIEAVKHLPVICTEEEMKRLEMTLKRK